MKWVVVALAVLAGGWMVFDGVRALVVGDYVRIGGELGPWTSVVEAVGIDPAGTPMKVFLVVYGSAWLVAAQLYAWGAPYARAAMVAFAACSLWYLVAGTVSGLVQLGLLTLGHRRRPVPAR